MRLISTVLLILSVTVTSLAQFHQEVFKGLEGESLKVALQNDFTPGSVLSYTKARDTFMSKIDVVDGRLHTIYTNYSIEMPLDVDPTTYAYARGINTEHVYPRSMGPVEGTLAYSDMHHLFPCYAEVNSDRGNLPLREISDDLTAKWYRYNYAVASIPDEYIDEYSEYLPNVGFEPREDVKGDVARAYFYIRTIYEDETNREAPQFFETQVEDLCLWHAVDPVDEKEWKRNLAIAKYQDGKVNPFILDCSLARLYCDDLSVDCIAVDVIDVNQSIIESLPNPWIEEIEFRSSFKGKIELYSIDGQFVTEYLLNKGNNMISAKDLFAGTYIARIFDENHQFIQTIKIIKL